MLSQRGRLKTPFQAAVPAAQAHAPQPAKPELKALAAAVAHPKPGAGQEKSPARPWSREAFPQPWQGTCTDRLLCPGAGPCLQQDRPATQPGEGDGVSAARRLRKPGAPPPPPTSPTPGVSQRQGDGASNGGPREGRGSSGRLPPGWAPAGWPAGGSPAPYCFSASRPLMRNLFLHQCRRSRARSPAAAAPCSPPRGSSRTSEGSAAQGPAPPPEGGGRRSLPRQSEKSRCMPPRGWRPAGSAEPRAVSPRPNRARKGREEPSPERRPAAPVAPAPRRTPSAPAGGSLARGRHRGGRGREEGAGPQGAGLHGGAVPKGRGPAPRGKWRRAAGGGCCRPGWRRRGTSGWSRRAPPRQGRAAAAGGGSQVAPLGRAGGRDRARFALGVFPVRSAGRRCTA